MSKKPADKKAWTGRMDEATHPLVDEFTSSYSIDSRLSSFDIDGSIAHCRMLAAQKIIPSRDAAKIVRALGEIRREFETRTFCALPSDEDVHMAIERRLIEKIGPVGGKLHTARSRNDQVALDFRLYCRSAIDRLQEQLQNLILTFCTVAEENSTVILPGYTHLQQAQPILLAHHLLAYAQMFTRDRERLADARRRTNILPLGSGALAGTTFPIDRELVAKLLSFPAVTQNSLDAVSDRDFAVELLSSLALIGMHLSRLSEEIVIWASQEFGFIDLPDGFATGSSMMPQKKNPDVAELIRGRTGRLYGNLMNLLTVLKGLPLTYNRDLQEDKAPVFDSVDGVGAALEIMAAMIPNLRFRTDRMRSATAMGHTLATELADYLATNGIPFREAHGIVGAIVRRAVQQGRSLDSFTIEELRSFSPVFQADVANWLDLDSAIRRRRATGGTAPENVRRQIRQLRKPR